MTGRRCEPSLWDRLLDPYDELVGGRWYDEETYRLSVARDIETLLNTYCVVGPELERLGFRDAASTVIAFGHPGVPVENPLTAAEVRSLERWYATTIRRFDRRLSNVTVRLDVINRDERGAAGLSRSTRTRRLILRVQAELVLPPDERDRAEFKAEFDGVEQRHIVTAIAG